MLKKYQGVILLTLVVLILSACGDAEGSKGGDYPVPEELIISSEPGMESFEDQFGLQIGETAYLAEVRNQTGLAITLNEVTLTDEVGGDSHHDDRFYMIANVTVSNFGENLIASDRLEYPMLADASDAEVLEAGDDLSRNELFGVGVKPPAHDERIDRETINPGDEVTGDFIISVDEELEEYLIWFGYQGFSNDATFEFSANEAKVDESM
jgi:hypothetical protein